MKQRILGFAIASLLGLGAVGCAQSALQDAPPMVPPDNVEQSEAQAEGEVQVYAAASLKGAFDELVSQFNEEHPEIKVATPVYDGSSTLVEQISEGAPADVFASADEKNMDKIVTAGLNTETPQVFATNKVTIAVPAGNPKGITSLEDLADPDVKVVLCAPEVPCGNTAEKLLAQAGVEVDPVSLEQNVTAVATKVAAGEADAGIIYVTDVQAFKGELEAIPTEVPADLVNLYPIVTLTGATNPAGAQTFIDFVMSDQGQSVLKEFGFGPAQ